MKDKSNLNHGRGNIACAFPWCSFLIVINIAAGRLLKLCIHELLHANNSEENIKGILNYCSEAEVYGIICFGMGLTLREGSREYFFRQLDHLFPGMKEKYLQTYGMQYQIVSNKNDELMQLFHHTCEKNGIVHDNRKIFEYLSTFETKCDNVQLSLFDKDFAGKSPNGI